MKNLYVTAFSLIFLLPSAFSQGIILDSAGFASRTSVRITRGVLPKVYSMKKYTPMVFPQVGSTCVAQSFATARTILAARSLGWTDQTKITSIYFSPYYIYYRNKSDNDYNCNNGLNVENAARDVLENGFAPISEVEYPLYYPFTGQALCIEKNGTDYPPSMEEDADIASRYKINEIYTVTTLQQVKTALSSGMPIALILFPPPSFQNVKTDLWTSLPDEYQNRNTMAHAVLAVGYNDLKNGGCIEIMNSWGDTWGDKGFTCVKYKDYEKFFWGGYAFYLKNSNPVNKTPIKKPVTPPVKKHVSPTVIKVKTGYGGHTTNFNNKEFIKAFEK